MTTGRERSDGSILFGAEIEPGEQRDICERCDGTGDGRAFNEYECPDCHGLGYIEHEPDVPPCTVCSHVHEHADRCGAIDVDDPGPCGCTRSMPWRIR